MSCLLSRPHTFSLSVKVWHPDGGVGKSVVTLPREPGIGGRAIVETLDEKWQSWLYPGVGSVETEGDLRDFF